MPQTFNSYLLCQKKKKNYYNKSLRLSKPFPTLNNLLQTKKLRLSPSPPVIKSIKKKKKRGFWLLLPGATMSMKTQKQPFSIISKWKSVWNMSEISKAGQTRLLFQDFTAETKFNLILMAHFKKPRMKCLTQGARTQGLPCSTLRKNTQRPSNCYTQALCNSKGESQVCNTPSASWLP